MEGAGQDVLAGVLLHLVKPPCPVDLLVDGGALFGLGDQGLHRVPDDALFFVDVGDLQHLPVGQGQGAPVSGLAAPLGIKYGAGHGDPAAAPFQGLDGRN